MYNATRVLSWSAPTLPAHVAADLAGAGIEIVFIDLAENREARHRQVMEIEDIRVGITGARAALADTGSVVLATGPGQSRLASLLPPVHIALVAAGQIYPSLPAFIAANPAILDEAANVVVVTGPSRTADIEMTLSRGVHGPRHVHLVVTD
jgi:L-lactate dehydrogenase complex protein LldG